MDKFKLIGFLAVFSLTACNSTPHSNVTNYYSKGNLESPLPSSCVAIDRLSNKQNPVDIFTGLNSCIANGDYSKAAELYFAGMTYGYYDINRVSDKSAHQAISVIRMNVFGAQPKEVMDKLQAAIEKIASDNTSVCQSLTRLGAPMYKPTYMIQHGMGAFLGNSTKDGLVENFDSNSTWSNSLAKIAKCI